jgi:hypothetical protein
MLELLRRAGTATVPGGTVTGRPYWLQQTWAASRDAGR